MAVDFLLNGDHRHGLEICDRGLHYGDGLFETLEVYQGLPLFWDLHFQRLYAGCQRLSIPAPDEALLKQEALCLAKDCQHGVLKIIVTRGCGGRGYRPPLKPEATRLLSLHPWPDYPADLHRQGIHAILCRSRVGLNPDLAGLKHLNRLEQVLARSEWDQGDVHEGLMSNIQGEVIEGTMTNVFLVKNGGLFTPELSQAGVAGIVRSLVLQIAEKFSIPLQKTSIRPEQLFMADELFVTNSIIGIWPLRQLEDKQFTPGPITQKIQNAYRQLWRQQVNHV